MAGRRVLLERRLSEVNAKAVAEEAAERLYAMLPNARITAVLDDVHRWTGFAEAFTHLHTGLPAENPRVVLTAVLADATNMGLTRMADACSVASHRELAWNAGWHLRGDTQPPDLAIMASALQRHPLAALFGAADVFNSDGEALGAHDARHGHGREATGLSRPTSRPACPVPHRIHPALGRGGLRHRRPALPRGRPAVSVHHTDGGGVSDHVLALAHLLGF